MSARTLLAVAALSLLGCSPTTSRCKDGTLLVAVTLDATSAQADQLSVTLSIDGVPAAPTQVARQGAQATGNLLVQFPHGYPRGHVVAVEIDALVAGVVVGTGSAAQPLESACEVLPLAVTAAAPSDLGADLGADLGGAADLYSPPDLTCIPTAESGDACFDGVDNDCDGLVDCADPDCAAGAQCVPAVGSAFTLGITVNAASFCPAMFSARSVVNEGLAPVGADCPTSTCSCTPSMSCSSGVTSWPASGCSGESDANSAAAVCRNFNVSAPTVGLSSDPTIINGGGSCGVGGTSARSGTAWASTQRFCQTSAIGGGCAPGNVCVPKLSVATCAVADGQVACDPGYTEMTGPWYTDFTDGRSCACACGAASGGACGTTIGIYTSTDCSGTPAVTMNANQSLCTAAGTYHTTKILGVTQPTCGAPSTTLTGALMPTGRQTLCCRP